MVVHNLELSIFNLYKCYFSISSCLLYGDFHGTIGNTIFFKHMYLLHLVQYQWSLVKNSVLSLHITHEFMNFVCIEKHTPVPCVENN
jgi:hypothetical protein